MKRFVLLFLPFVLVACSQNDDILENEKQERVSSPYELSLADAMKNADAVFAEMDGGTRSESRQLESFEVIYDQLDPGGKIGSFYKSLVMYYNFVPVLSNPVVTASGVK